MERAASKNSRMIHKEYKRGKRLGRESPCFPCKGGREGGNLECGVREFRCGINNEGRGEDQKKPGSPLLAYLGNAKNVIAGERKLRLPDNVGRGWES